jgi:hypothetical protein
MQPDSNGNPDRAATLLTFTNEPHRFDISLSLKKKAAGLCIHRSAARHSEHKSASSYTALSRAAYHLYGGIAIVTSVLTWVWLPKVSTLVSAETIAGFNTINKAPTTVMAQINNEMKWRFMISLSILKEEHFQEMIRILLGFCFRPAARKAGCFLPTRWISPQPCRSFWMPAKDCDARAPWSFLRPVL